MANKPPEIRRAYLINKDEYKKVIGEKNLQLEKSGENFRYVILGTNYIPIDKRYVEAFYKADRKTRRKLLSKFKKIKHEHDRKNFHKPL